MTKIVDEMEAVEGASDELVDFYPLARLVVALVCGWSKPEDGPLPADNAIHELLTAVSTRVPDLDLGNAPQTALTVFAAWVAAQAGDRQRALELVRRIVSETYAAVDPDPLAASFVLTATAWICATGGQRPHPALVDLAQVLLPTELRGERTATLFRAVEQLAKLLLPGGTS